MKGNGAGRIIFIIAGFLFGFLAAERPGMRF
jgi:hypothetical protein